MILGTVIVIFARTPIKNKFSKFLFKFFELELPSREVQRNNDFIKMAQIQPSKNLPQKYSKRQVRISILCFLRELESLTSIILIMIKFLIFFLQKSRRSHK